MNRYLAITIIMFFSTLGMLGRQYSVGEIPNVQLKDYTKHLSNPDGIISQPAQARVDSLLMSIRQLGAAQMSVVVVDDVDTDDLDTFATDLFEEWGIGEKGKDNGVLLLIVKDQRQAVIRTGYGSEEYLPDVVSGIVIRDDMAPYFKEGDYDQGLIAGVTAIHEILNNPEIAEAYKSQAQKEKDQDREDMITYLVKVPIGIAVALVLYALGMIWYIGKKKGNERPDVQYNMANTTMRVLSIAAIFTAGTPLLAMGIIGLWRRNLRKKAPTCPNCHVKMQKLAEDIDNQHLSPSQDLEERIKSVDYDVWVCPQCNYKTVMRYDRSSRFTECQACHTKAVALVDTRTLRQPTQSHDGLKELTYQCLHCNRKTVKTEAIPAFGGAAIGGGGFGGRSGGGGFGGSWGGGHTGGGGARGGW